MIKIENIHTCNWEAAIRGMRNPMNSWDKSDSYYTDGIYILGPNDLKLAKQLATAGSDHGKFLRTIIFSCDITAPMYWWKEADTYKVGTVRNSCSTMHKITEKEFTVEDFSVEHLSVDNANIYHLPENDFRILNNKQWFLMKVDLLNSLRDEYIATKNKQVWYQLIQLLPSSYNQKATWTANYEVLRNIYHARKNHKLDEWHVFCDMIEELPYSELITEKR